MNIHRATIGGRLGFDPKLKTLDSGKVVCNLSVATNESRKAANGDYEKVVTWHSADVWGKSAEWVSNSLHKGDFVFIEGKNDYKTWTDDKGNKRSSVNIKVTNIQAVQKDRENTITASDLPF